MAVIRYHDGFDNLAPRIAPAWNSCYGTLDMELLIALACLLAGGLAYSIRATNTRPVPGSDSYAVSRDGRVLLTKGKKVKALRPRALPDGLLVELRSGTRLGQFYIHVLVAEAHLPNPAKRTQVRHRDGNKRNNNLANLEWY